jgi:hypothetical protein
MVDLSASMCRRLLGGPISTWANGLAEWDVGDTTYLSVAFTWLLDLAANRAIIARALGKRVIAGGPALFLKSMRHELEDFAEIGADYPDAVARHNPLATFASRGCPVGCGFCIVPAMEGREFTLLPHFTVRPVLCDNNLSALTADYQDFIIERYHAAGVPLLDANSGFEPMTFTPDVYARWKPLVNNEAGLKDPKGHKYPAGPWRFAYDETKERADVLRVMRMLAPERRERKRVYVLIGNEPFEDCMRRIQEVLDHGCEPHVQPVMKLAALEKRPWIRHDWTERKLRDVTRWANRRAWKYTPFSGYVPNLRSRDRYDAQQGLWT